MVARSSPKAVLFACHTNAIRSPMAGALARHFFPGLYIATAGVIRGEADPFAAAVMDEIGIDIRKHQPATFEDLEDSYFDLIVTLAPDAHHRALELTRHMAVDVEYWPTPDASAIIGSREQIIGAYRDVRDLLGDRVRERFGWVTTPAG